MPGVPGLPGLPGGRRKPRELPVVVLGRVQVRGIQQLRKTLESAAVGEEVGLMVLALDDFDLQKLGTGLTLREPVTADDPKPEEPKPEDPKPEDPKPGDDEEKDKEGGDPGASWTSRPEDDLVSAQTTGKATVPPVPLLLLPVRLETAYVDHDPVVDGPALLVRVWPDDVHVDTLGGEELTETEIDLGRQLQAASGSEGAATRAAVRRRLEQVAGAGRARLVVDLVEAERLPAAAGDPWSGRPVARLLPERMHVRVELAHPQTPGDRQRTGATTHAHVDRAEPGTTAALGPGPEDSDGGGAHGSGEAWDWLHDLEQAERHGLALRVPLPSRGAPVRRITVSGVVADSDADDVAALLRSHAYTAGLDVAPPLSDTKGLDADSGRSDPWQGVRRRPVHGSLAAALGLEPDDVPLPPAPDTAELEAAAAHVVWHAAVRPALIEGFGLHDAYFSRGKAVNRGLAREIDALRDRFTAACRVGGPYPTLLIDQQPYGVLPVASDTRHTPPRTDTDRSLRERLPGAVDAFARAAEDSRDAERVGGRHEAALRGLARHPIGQEWRVRPMIDLAEIVERLTTAGDPTLIQTEAGRFEDLLARVDERLSMLGLPAGGRVGAELASGYAFRVCGPLVDPESLERLLASPLADFLRDDEDEKPTEKPEEGRGGPRPLLDVLAETAILAVAAEAVAATDRDPAAVLDGESRTTELPSRHRILARDLVPRRGPKTTVTTLLEQAAKAGQGNAAEARALLDALRVLIDQQPDALHAAVAGALDVASHRIDAWLTSFALDQLAELRSRDPHGLRVGAWGVVEDLAPDAASAAPETGFRLAPSMAHAATAALLSHARSALPSDSDGNPLLELDLTPARVRRGLALAALLRRGEPLGEALGLLAVEQLRDDGGLPAARRAELATSYPLREGARSGDEAENGGAGSQVPDVGTAAARTGRIDGLALLASTGRRDADAREAVRDAMTGLQHLLLAEGAHLLAAGRPDAAAATFEAMGAGGAPPDVADVVSAQRSAEADDLTVALMTTPTAGGGDRGAAAEQSLWLAACPELDRLVAELMGPVAGVLTVEVSTPESAPVSVAVPLGDLGLAPIELVLLARGGDDTLSALAPLAVAVAVRGDRGVAPRADGLLPAADVRPDRDALDTLWAAERAAASLAGARGLTRRDLAHPQGPAAEDQPRYDLAAEAAALAGLQERTHELDVLIDGGVENQVLTDSLLAAHRSGLIALRLSDLQTPAARRTAALTALASGARRRTVEGEPGSRLPLLLPDLPVPSLVTLEEEDRAAWPTRPLPGAGAADLAGWIETSAVVREQLAPLADLMLAGAGIGVRVAQWPAPERGGADPDPWIGHAPADGRSGGASVVAVGIAGRSAPEQVCGLVLDTWQEVVPHTEASLGVAAPAATPPARAPQVALLALPPVDGDWSTEAVHDCVRLALDLAKARTVDLRELPAAVPHGQKAAAGQAREPYDGPGWLLPLLRTTDHESDPRATACPPRRREQDL